MPFLLPTVAVSKIVEITPELLQTIAVKGLILDVDNTLAGHGDHVPFAGTIEWSHKMRKSGIRLIIVSNNTRTRVAPFAAQYDLPFLSRAMKPLPPAYRKACRQMQLNPRQVAVVGDQVFTDVLGANLSFVKSILLKPVTIEQSRSFRIRREWEKKIRKKIEMNYEKEGNLWRRKKY